MKKIVTVLGARPQFIKASAVSRILVNSSQFKEVVVHTGQHFDTNMSDYFFAELGMKNPTYFLDIHGGGHGNMTGRMLIDIEKVLLNENPDLVLVYGDTNSTLAGALAAAKLRIPVAHVESGLRSFNMTMPEEINRILTDRLSQWLFTPTERAADHLLREGVSTQKIVPVGDVMFDVALQYGAQALTRDGILNRLKLQNGVQAGSYCLATIHRAENTDNCERLAVIIEALSVFSGQIPVIWPLHPRTRSVLEQLGKLELLAQSVFLIDPLGYLDMVQLEKNAAVVATDSGGIQKEAYFFKVPCVTLRDETEWVELVEAGWNRLAPPVSVDAVLDALRASLGSQGKVIAPYGQGNASQLIVQRLEKDLVIDV